MEGNNVPKTTSDRKMAEKQATREVQGQRDKVAKTKVMDDG